MMENIIAEMDLKSAVEGEFAVVMEDGTHVFCIVNSGKMEDAVTIVGRLNQAAAGKGEDE
jgi:hypothetical protein